MFGVTAAAGVAAYAGIPLTHREHAQSVVFATGFLKEGKIDLDWPMLARPQQTVVIYMGISRLADICAQFIAHGLPPSTPAGVIERGTTHAQRVVVADLATQLDDSGRAERRADGVVPVDEEITTDDLTSRETIEDRIQQEQPDPNSDIVPPDAGHRA